MSGGIGGGGGWWQTQVGGEGGGKGSGVWGSVLAVRNGPWGKRGGGGNVVGGRKDTRGADESLVSFCHVVVVCFLFAADGGGFVCRRDGGVLMFFRSFFLCGCVCGCVVYIFCSFCYEDVFPLFFCACATVMGRGCFFSFFFLSFVLFYFFGFVCSIWLFFLYCFVCIFPWLHSFCVDR